VTDKTKCTCLMQGTVAQLAKLSTAVRLQVNTTSNVFGSWTSTARLRGQQRH
jgi:hypothetical protein